MRIGTAFLLRETRIVYFRGPSSLKVRLWTYYHRKSVYKYLHPSSLFSFPCCCCYCVRPLSLCSCNTLDRHLRRLSDADPRRDWELCKCRIAEDDRSRIRLRSPGEYRPHHEGRRSRDIQNRGVSRTLNKLLFLVQNTQILEVSLKTSDLRVDEWPDSLSFLPVYGDCGLLLLLVTVSRRHMVHEIYTIK